MLGSLLYVFALGMARTGLVFDRKYGSDDLSLMTGMVPLISLFMVGRVKWTGEIDQFWASREEYVHDQYATSGS
jgi:hypothetical protein